MLDQHLGVLAGEVVAGANGHVVCGRAVEIVAPLGLVMTVYPNDRSDDDVYLGGKGSLVERLGRLGLGRLGVAEGDLVDEARADAEDQRSQGSGCKAHLDVDEQVLCPNIHDKGEKTKSLCSLWGIGRDFIPRGSIRRTIKSLELRNDLMHSLSAHRCPNARNRQFEGIVACQLICY